MSLSLSICKRCWAERRETLRLEAEAKWASIEAARKGKMSSGARYLSVAIDKLGRADERITELTDEEVENQFKAGIMVCPYHLEAVASAVRWHTHVGLPPPPCCPFDKRVLHIQKKKEDQEGNGND